MRESQNYESLEEAITTCICLSGFTNKKIANILWPSVPFQTAYQRLTDALNPSKRQKLTVDEIILIMKTCDRYDVLDYMADQCLHERPRKRTTVCEQKEKSDVKNKLEEFIEQSKKMYDELVSLLSDREKTGKINSTVFEFQPKQKIGNVG